MRTRNKQISFYLSEKEYEKFKTKLEKTKLNQSDFIRLILLEKQILIVPDLKDFLVELKRIGNNLNQLTRAVNVGKVNCKNEVEELKKEVGELWQLLKSLKVEKH